MIKKEDISVILASAQAYHAEIDVQDIAFVILCDAFADKGVAYSLAYGEESSNAEKVYNGKKISALLDAMQPFGYGKGNIENSVTSEQNKTELIKLLQRIQNLADAKEISRRDAVKMEADIRVKLNDKFEMEESQKQKRIIVVPQKHDCVRPHTHRECTFMPTKEACIEYYHLDVNE